MIRTSLEGGGHGYPLTTASQMWVRCCSSAINQCLFRGRPRMPRTDESCRLEDRRFQWVGMTDRDTLLAAALEQPDDEATGSCSPTPCPSSPTRSSRRWAVSDRIRTPRPAGATPTSHGGMSGRPPDEPKEADPVDSW